MSNKIEDVKFFTLEDEKHQMMSFFNEYHVIKSATVNEFSSKQALKPRKERTCRFCNKKYPEVTFKSKAHSIPELFGNKKLFNDFECDQCNSVFSKYETDLGEYFKLQRTIYGTRGKKGIPKIESIDKTKLISRNNDGIITFINKNNIIVTENGINLQEKKKYTPINVYKALVKTALSILGDKEFENYKNFVQTYLLHKDNDSEILPLAKIGFYELNQENKVDELKYVVFQKKLDTNIPYHLFSFYYQNIILNIPIPLNLFDILKGYHTIMKVKMPPPLAFSPLNNQSKIEFKQLDLGNTNKVTTIENIKIALDEEELRGLIEKELGTKLPENFTIDEFAIKLDS